MIIVTCLPCALAIRVLMNVGNETFDVEQLVGPHSEFWPDRFPCPRCSHPAMGIFEREAEALALQALEVKDLTAQEAFAAFHGLGFPDEQRCSLEIVQQLLLETPIRKVHGRTLQGSERLLIDHLELWNGAKLYFGSGADGAVVYRITSPISYTDKALEDGRD